MKNKIDQNKRERTSWIVLIFIVLSGLAIPEVFQVLNEWSEGANGDSVSETSQKWESIDSLYLSEKKKYPSTTKKYYNKKPKKYPKQNQKRFKKKDDFNKPLKSFDPNSASDSLLLWVFPDKIANNIIKYRNSGGRFYNSEALRKIYGMEQDLYNQVAAFIDIPQKIVADNTRQKAVQKHDKFAQPSIIEINSADSTAWTSIRGIGPVLANRIIKFRDRLGGFHSVNQIGETYGLEAEVFESFKDQLQIKDSISQLDVNHLNIYEIARHPYINKKQASWIVKYRNQHGEFRFAEDLLKIRTLDTNFVNKLIPYLSFIVSDVEPSEVISLKR